MTTTFDWAAPGTYSAGNLITGDGTSGDLKNLANAAIAQGAEVNNEGGTIYAGVELMVRLASGASGSPHVRIWFVTALDGTNYEDGSTSVEPTRAPDIVFPIRLSTTTQMRMVIGPVMLPNAKFKATLKNYTGQAFTNTNSENQLSYRTWKDEGA